MASSPNLSAYKLLEPAVLGSGGAENVASFTTYFASIIKTTLVLGAFLAVLMIVIGGVEKIISKTPAGKTDGNEKIYGALVGLFLLIISATILTTINPNLLNLEFFKPGAAAPVVVDQPRDPVRPPDGPIDPVDADGWDFNNGIQSQLGDASSELASLLSCMETKLNAQGITGKITSISDRNHIGNLEVCRDSTTHGSSNCAHGNSGGRGSCHYGGNNVGSNKSYAVDLGMANSGPVSAAARECGAAQVINEGNHLHVEAPGCR